MDVEVGAVILLSVIVNRAQSVFLIFHFSFLIFNCHLVRF